MSQANGLEMDRALNDVRGSLHEFIVSESGVAADEYSEVMADAIAERMGNE